MKLTETKPRCRSHDYAGEREPNRSDVHESGNCRWRFREFRPLVYGSGVDLPRRGHDSSSSEVLAGSYRALYQVWCMMIRAVLADDEVLARQKLRQLLRDEEDLEIAGECASAAEVIQLVGTSHPELLFLDIRLPDMDGFDVVGALNAIHCDPLPHIIFTTAFDQYAVRAFEIHAVDYLLKPFTQERLRSAVHRVRQRISLTSERQDQSTSEPKHDAYTDRIVFKSRGRILFLSVDEIRWVEAEENYVRIFTSSESHLLRETMANLEARLDPQSFLRVHRSAIVNLHFVKEVKSEVDGDAIVTLTNGKKIAMSRSYRARIHDLLHR